MVEALWVNASLHLVVAAAFAGIGRRVLRPDAPRAVAARAFASWWFLYAVQSVLEAIQIMAVAGGSRDPALYQGLFQVQTIVAVAALWGLGAYVQYVSRGEPRGWIAWAAVLGLLAAFYTWVVSYHQFASIDAGRWQPTFELARPMEPATQLFLVSSYYGILIGLAFWLVLVAGGSGDEVMRYRSLALMTTLMVLSIEGIASLGLQVEVAAGGLLSFARLPAALLVYLAYRLRPTSGKSR